MISFQNAFQCLAATGDWAEMDEALSQVASPGLKESFLFKCLALKCNVMNRRPEKAWAIFTDQPVGDAKDSKLCFY